MGICYIGGAAEVGAIKIEKEETDYIIAADGGRDTLKKFGIQPDLWLGDMDSVQENYEEEAEQYPVEKDQTDLFLALEQGLSRGYQTFVIYGALGGRLDHTLANLSHLVYLAKRGARGYLVDEKQFATTICNEKIVFEKGSGIISILAAEKEACRVSIQGLKYTLWQQNLAEEFPLGVSNQFIDQKAEIMVEDGVLWIISEIENLPQLLK